MENSASFETDLRLFFRNILSVIGFRPMELLHYLKVAWWQRQAYKKRQRCARDNGLVVPPVIIASLTRKCNLACSGCYARSLAKENGEVELAVEEFRRVLSEAQALGAGIVFLAGGEPLMRQDLLAVTEQFPRVQFLLFTNGMLIDQTEIKRLKARRNIFPMLSIEGHSGVTDARRGEGVFKKIENGMTMLRNAGMHFGVSITVTAQNRDMVTDRAFVSNLLQRGCKLFIFVSYLPVTPSFDATALSIEEHDAMMKELETFRKEFRALFVAFPGDEKKYGGCISSGRGFIHLSASGNVEPCPFSPFSDADIRNTSLEEALRSPLLKTIRDNRHILEEHGGACALFEHREWVEAQVKKNQTDTEVECVELLS